jgi:hypothetical protein
MLLSKTVQIHLLINSNIMVVGLKQDPLVVDLRKEVSNLEELMVLLTKMDIHLL